MWSGTFGHYKEDNTPHLFNVNGIEIELTAGEVANFSSLMADTLIAAGFAEYAEI